MKCPVCNSDHVHKRRRYNELDLLVCLDCGLGFANPLVDGNREVGYAKSSITNSDYYSNIKADFHAQCLLAEQKAVGMLAYWEKISKRRPASVLEIGCGTGAYCQAFNKLNVLWRGFEINQNIVEFANQNGVPVENINVIEKCIDEKYDVIFMSQVLEHVFEPYCLLAKIKNMMKMDSILHLDVPNHDSLMSIYRKCNLFQREYGFLQPYHHLIAYNGKSLTHLLLTSGLKIAEIVVCSNDHPVLGQLIVNPSFLHSAVMRCSDLLNRGSLLVAIAKKT